MTEPRYCVTCAFFDTRCLVPVCKRYAPSESHKWPFVKAEDWCCEHSSGQRAIVMEAYEKYGCAKEDLK